MATGRTICLLGSDTEVRPGTFETMLGFLDAHPEAGAVAPRLVNADGSIQRACMRFPDLKVALARSLEIAALTATASVTPPERIIVPAGISSPRAPR